MFTNMRRKFGGDEQGFTLIELLVVIVIIGVLAAIALPIFLNQQKAAFEAHAKSDLRQLSQAITLAKVKTGDSLMTITGSNFTAGGCAYAAIGTNLATLPQTDTCWTTYKYTLNKISLASGIDVKGLLDPYGRPYYIDENEGEGGGCSKDVVGFYINPITTTDANVGAKTSYNVSVYNATSACT